MNEDLDQRRNKGPLLTRIVQHLIENTKARRTDVSFFQSGLGHRSRLITGDLSDSSDPEIETE